eukprot:31323-Pelagococcus_subviridis.AAC.13
MPGVTQTARDAAGENQPGRSNRLHALERELRIQGRRAAPQRNVVRRVDAPNEPFARVRNLFVERERRVRRAARQHDVPPPSVRVVPAHVSHRRRSLGRARVERLRDDVVADETRDARHARLRLEHETVQIRGDDPRRSNRSQRRRCRRRVAADAAAADAVVVVVIGGVVFEPPRAEVVPALRRGRDLAPHRLRLARVDVEAAFLRRERDVLAPALGPRRVRVRPVPGHRARRAGRADDPDDALRAREVFVLGEKQRECVSSERFAAAAAAAAAAAVAAIAVVAAARGAVGFHDREHRGREHGRLRAIKVIHPRAVRDEPARLHEVQHVARDPFRGVAHPAREEPDDDPVRVPVVRLPEPLPGDERYVRRRDERVARRARLREGVGRRRRRRARERGPERVDAPRERSEILSSDRRRERRAVLGPVPQRARARRRRGWSLRRTGLEPLAQKRARGRVVRRRRRAPRREDVARGRSRGRVHEVLRVVPRPDALRGREYRAAAVHVHDAGFVVIERARRRRRTRHRRRVPRPGHSGGRSGCDV